MARSIKRQSKLWWTPVLAHYADYLIVTYFLE